MMSSMTRPARGQEVLDDALLAIADAHEMAFARDIADRVCFLDAGAICEQGPPGIMLTEPREPRTRQFLQRIIEAGRI